MLGNGYRAITDIPSKKKKKLPRTAVGASNGNKWLYSSYHWQKHVGCSSKGEELWEFAYYAKHFLLFLLCSRCSWSCWLAWDSFSSLYFQCTGNLWNLVRKKKSGQGNLVHTSLQCTYSFAGIWHGMTVNRWVSHFPWNAINHMLWYHNYYQLQTILPHINFVVNHSLAGINHGNTDTFQLADRMFGVVERRTQVA